MKKGKTNTADPRSSPWTSWERTLLFLVLSVGVFLRLYRLGDVPPGMNVDTSIIGLGGLRVLHEGWRPFFEDSFSTHPGLIYYLSAVWFHFLEPSRLHWFLFAAFLSILSLGSAYPVFRRLADPVTALAALWFLAVMRWDLALSRGYPLHDATLFMVLALGFWLKGLNQGGQGVFGACAIALSLGLYTYHGYKPFLLLMVVLALYEAIVHREKFLERRNALLLFLGLSILLTGPMLLHWMRAGNFGGYETSLFIGKAPEGAWTAFLRNLGTFFLCFHFRGDTSSYVNFASHPMLDGVTGSFFLLGLWRTVRQWKQRACFYALAGLAVMGLNSLLSIHAEGSLGRRLFGVLPFVALLSGLGLSQAVRFVLGQWTSPLGRDWGKGLALLLLLGAGALNFRDYFILQAKDPGYQQVSDQAATALAERIAGSRGRFQFLLDARYDGHHTVRFMNYSRQGDFRRLDYPQGLRPFPVSTQQGVCFVLAEGEMGLFAYLKDLHPKGRPETLRDAQGNPLLYLLEVDNEELLRDRKKGDRKVRGLQGAYFTEGSASPALLRWEPLLNFPHKTNFGLTVSSLRAEWKGRLEVREAGPYEFLLLMEPEDLAELRLDGKTWIPRGERSPVLVDLKAGGHDLRLSFRSGPGLTSALSLAWKRPGESKFEIIPNSAFGLVP